MASIVEKRLGDGSKAYLVRFRTADGRQRSKQFKRKREADAYVSLVEVDRMSGALIDPRLGRITVDEWWRQWWPTVTNLRASTRARDAQFYHSHIRPAFGDTPLNKLDRIVSGDLDEIISALQSYRQAELLRAGGLSDAMPTTFGGDDD